MSSPSPESYAYEPPLQHPEHWDAKTAAMMARALERSGRYRVVERLERRTRYSETVCNAPRRGLYVDVETTGTTPGLDKIIQLAIAPFAFDPAGQIYEVDECQSWLEDPGIPIPDFVSSLTGISDAVVRGKRIDDELANQALVNCDLVVAHNAPFDRSFLELRLPRFQRVIWGCSMIDVPWDKEGVRARSLEMLAYQHCRVFYEAHRADSDCYMGIHLLASSLPSGQTALAALLNTVRQPSVRIWAISAPYDRKALLKQRGYRWSSGEGGRPKAWFREVAESEGDSEMEWLRTTIYDQRGFEAARRDKVDRKLRHSDRAGMPSLRE